MDLNGAADFEETAIKYLEQITNQVLKGIMNICSCVARGTYID